MQIPDRHALLVFAKVPELGIAKSRIAAKTGKGTAERIYSELLKATAAIAGPFEYHVAYAGAPEPRSLRGYFTGARSFFIQRGRSLGDRLRNAFLHLFARGSTSICALGCDCPFVTGEDIVEGLRRLSDGTHTVIGPARDGGYYLVGCRPDALDIFSVRSWGPPRLTAETLSVIYKKNYSCRFLPTRRDIDTIEDYRAWRGEGTGA